MSAGPDRLGGQSVVVLYGRPGCHLCELAREELLAMRRAGASFELRDVDIESDDRLHREMLESIPVVEVDGARVSELIFDADAVRARLATFVE
jgi:glutaredoxin